MSYTRKQYMNQEVSHADYYGQFVTDEVMSMFSDKMKEAIIASTDPHLNDIPMVYWDKLAGFRTPFGKVEAIPGQPGLPSDVLSAIAKANGTGGVSLSDRICVLKAAARRLK